MTFVNIKGRLINLDQIEIVGQLGGGESSLIRFASGATADVIGVTVAEIEDGIAAAEYESAVVRAKALSAS